MAEWIVTTSAPSTTSQRHLGKGQDMELWVAGQPGDWIIMLGEMPVSGRFYYRADAEDFARHDLFDLPGRRGRSS